MAIIVEEEKKSTNFSSTIGWVILVVIVVVAAYYLFIAPVSPSIITPPAGLQNISSFSNLTIDPTSVTNNPQFQALKQSITEPASSGPVSVGKSDPFLP